MLDESITILPTARAIRHEQLQIENETLFLPNFITINEFISKLCSVKEYKLIDADSRILLLLEASDFKEFSTLKIERNFFTFTKNSSYIFKFFEELSQELYDISNLKNFDIYGDFEEHIIILEELYKRYEKLCNERKILDKIFLPKLYTFNEIYLKKYSEVVLHIDGHITNFEFELLERCCEYTQVVISFKTSRFNTKMIEKFLEFGVELERGYEYKISLNDKSVISKNKRVKNKNVYIESFSESLLQIGFIKQKVYEYIQKGYKPENIAVVLADESIAPKLKSFDKEFNFNFAMGESFRFSEIYLKLYATQQLLDQKTQENFARLERFGDSLYMKLLGIYHKDMSEVDIIKVLQEYKEEFSNKRELKILEEEIYSFKSVLKNMQNMSIKSLLSLFLQRLAARSLDDVRGGRVTVMGLLETRAVEFDAVIIVDFSDANVPKRSDKDMFLNTHIRESANLPTTKDRENLQKHYYDLLLTNSKEVSISYVKSSQSSGSRFIKQLGIEEKNIYNENEYAEILFHKTEQTKREEKRVAIDYSFKDKKISPTRLKTFLTCKRKYYHKYIEALSSHEIPKDMPNEFAIGNHVHSALSNLYKKRDSYDSAEVLFSDLSRELDAVKGDSELDSYLISMQKKILKKFCQEEVKRFSEGWRVVSCEENYECSFAGATLTGNIDRIDKRENEIYVLDYKTGSYQLYNKNNFTEATDFQLEFYYLLAGGLGNISGCGFYDLKESKIVNEAFLNEKLSILESHIKDLLSYEEIDFEMCEDHKHCLYCEFAIMCGRN